MPWNQIFAQFTILLGLCGCLLGIFICSGISYDIYRGFMSYKLDRKNLRHKPLKKRRIMRLIIRS
ncbi:hypothetical protein BCY91_15215 [Pelobium manganitolerans]|uniref:Uncharacterized protein n=1 Tax=Pelobium manganitolerans TaxID=1842495 RepID=A0A419S9K8_9SPHI|nr:hypothetical protein BCY91_15215 [Pelobium manganitolerans]